MKIVIITPGRSHLLDTAIQFLKHGHDVTFYTMVSRRRCQKFGLNKKNVISFYGVCAPLMFLFRKFKFPFDGNRLIYYIVCRIVDNLSAFFLKKCDIAITISGCSVKAILKAKRKYGSYIICDRGCKHILSQKRILEQIPSAKQVYSKDIAIELKQYEIADTITVPSSHAFESFIENGINKNRIFVNPYGVNLELFHPITTAKVRYDVIFVGNWSYQKGVDLLVEACEKANLTLLHVGLIIDCDFPEKTNFTHVQPVNQPDLINFYSQAKVLALPSRQDGFGLVLFQAMACGLSLVYSHDTGGPDIRNMIEHKELLFEMETYSVSALINALKQAIMKWEELGVQKNYLTRYDKQNISWDAYGNRYNKFIMTKNQNG